MKIFGAVLIIFACWVLGADFYKSNVDKLNYTKDLFSGIEVLKSEIVYSCDYLSDSLLKCVPFSGKASEFMLNISNELKTKGISTEIAFEKTGKIVAENTGKETYLLTKDLMLQLGGKDCENQEKLLEGYLKKLMLLIEKQEGFCKRECTMLKKTGAIAGIGIAVLLI